MRNKIGEIAKILVEIEDPENRGVFYLHKYFGNFTYFISHTKSIYLKNIGRDHGNTSYTFFYSNSHVFTCDTIPHTEDPVSTIIAILDYLTAEAGRHLSIQPNTFNQIMVPGHPDLAKPPHRVWEYMEEEEQKKQEVKFNWFSSNEDEIRKEAARIMEERKLGSG